MSGLMRVFWMRFVFQNVFATHFAMESWSLCSRLLAL